MEGIIIKGVGAYTPSNVVTNHQLSEIVDTSDEWIVGRTGIKERRISKGESTSYLATEAGKIAIKRAGVDPEDIDLIVLATCTPDYFVPSTACIVQKDLGAKNAMAFDLSAACTGFIYGLDVAKSLMTMHNYTHALVLGTETLSKIVDWKDRSTCVLFGDGAGAVVLSRSEEQGLINTYSKSDGEKYESLTAGAYDLNNPFASDLAIKSKTLQMDGQEVFRFATSIMASSVQKVLEESNIGIDEIDYIVPHQANVRIIEYAAKKLKLPKEKFFVNLDKYGNTSAASIPIALNEMYEKGLLKKGNKIVMVGFGGGLTYGASIVKWCI